MTVLDLATAAPTDARVTVRSKSGMAATLSAGVSAIVNSRDSIAISAGSMANGWSMASATCFGCTLPTGFSAEAIDIEVGLSSDTLEAGPNTTSTGAGIVRQLSQQSVPINTMFVIAADFYNMYVA